MRQTYALRAGESCCYGARVYVLMIVAFMIVLPIVSIAVELIVSGGDADVWFTIGKWFLFWGVGVRLFVAGLSQAFKPQFTAKSILGDEASTSALQVVQELGYANLGMGAVGLIAPWVSDWAVPGAIPATVFLGLAGLRHIAKPGKNRKELLATLTDLFVALVLLAFIIVSVTS